MFTPIITLIGALAGAFIGFRAYDPTSSALSGKLDADIYISQSAMVLIILFGVPTAIVIFAFLFPDVAFADEAESYIPYLHLYDSPALMMFLSVSLATGVIGIVIFSLIAAQPDFLDEYLDRLDDEVLETVLKTSIACYFMGILVAVTMALIIIPARVISKNEAAICDSFQQQGYLVECDQLKISEIFSGVYMATIDEDVFATGNDAVIPAGMLSYTIYPDGHIEIHDDLVGKVEIFSSESQTRVTV